jgi:non-ribosomal peptide synthetase component F
MVLSTFCFDLSVLEIFVALTQEATIVLAASSTRRNPFRIIELMKKFKVTFFEATPATYEMLIATGWSGDECSISSGRRSLSTSIASTYKQVCRSDQRIWADIGNH